MSNSKKNLNPVFASSSELFADEGMFYAKMYDVVMNWWFVQKWDEEDRNELVWAILDKIWAKRATYNPDKGGLWSWCFQVAKTASCSYWKECSKSCRFYDDEEDNVPEEELDLEKERLFEHRYNATNKALNELEGADRKLMDLYLCGKSGVEMSAEMGLSESNVRVRTHRLKTAIRNKVNSLRMPDEYDMLAA